MVNGLLELVYTLELGFPNSFRPESSCSSSCNLFVMIGWSTSRNWSPYCARLLMVLCIRFLCWLGLCSITSRGAIGGPCCIDPSEFNRASSLLSLVVVQVEGIKYENRGDHRRRMLHELVV